MDEKLILPNLMYSYFEQVQNEYYKYKLIEDLYVLDHLLQLHIFSLKNKTVSKREYEKFIIVKENNSKKLFGCVSDKNILDRINIDTGKIEESYNYSNLDQLDSVLEYHELW